MGRQAHPISMRAGAQRPATLLRICECGKHLREVVQPSAQHQSPSQASSAAAS